jgi:WD40 repeat protein
MTCVAVLASERSLAPIQELLPKSPLSSLQFSPVQQTLLVTGSVSGALSLFDHRSGAHPTASCNINAGHTEIVTGVAWSTAQPDVEVVSVSTDRQV